MGFFKKEKEEKFITNEQDENIAKKILDYLDNNYDIKITTVSCRKY
jgi:hypothetical protein